MRPVELSFSVLKLNQVLVIQKYFKVPIDVTIYRHEIFFLNQHLKKNASKATPRFMDEDTKAAGRSCGAVSATAETRVCYAEATASQPG